MKPSPDATASADILQTTAHLFQATGEDEEEIAFSSTPTGLTSTPGRSSHRPTERLLSLGSGVGMMVGMMIGSGIFASPGVVLAYTDSMEGALLVWLVTGLLSLSGALCYAELGSMLQESGGEQIYLGHIFGHFPSFLFAFFSCTVGKPCSIAILLIVFSEYFNRSVGLHSALAQTVTALIALLFLTLLNAWSSRAGILFQNGSTLAKLVAVLMVIGIGFGSRIKPQEPSQDVSAAAAIGGERSALVTVGSYALACYQGLWGYDGWNSLNFITGELKAPERNLLRAILISLPLVIVAYLIVNVAYFVSLPFEVIRSSRDVAYEMALKSTTPVVAACLGLGISISALGSANASIYTGARLVVASGHHGLIPFSSFLSHIHPNYMTPARALLLQAFLVLLFIVSGTYQSLIIIYGWLSWLFYGQCVLGLLLLRIRAPEKNWPRVYRVPLLFPILFLMATLILVLIPLIQTPKDIAVGLVLLGLSVIVYAIVYVERDRWALLFKGEFKLFFTRQSDYSALGHRSDDSLAG